MSLIQKLLAAECVDPCGEVRFVAVFRCDSEGAVAHCQASLAPLAGEIHVEESGGSYQFLFMGQVGADVDDMLRVMQTVLDEHPGRVELVETKVVNLNTTKAAHHSFTFRQEGAADATTIILSPSHAFGSGDHPSTALAIEILEELSPLEGHVLDIGCGTGVLSFVALRLGAQKVLGIDIDEEGLCGAVENAKLNHLETKVHFANIQPAEVTESFPLILANLTCSVLKYLLADLSSLAIPGGTLVVSGLQGRQSVEAETFLGEFGWQVTRRKSAGKWQALLAVKSTE